MEKTTDRTILEVTSARHYNLLLQATVVVIIWCWHKEVHIPSKHLIYYKSNT